MWSAFFDSFYALSYLLSAMIFHNVVFCRYAAPLGFVTSSVEAGYTLYRGLYCRYFVGLHHLHAGDGTSLPTNPGLVRLLRCCEVLLHVRFLVVVRH